jgi:hypothetical protein
MSTVCIYTEAVLTAHSYAILRCIRTYTSSLLLEFEAALSLSLSQSSAVVARERMLAILADLKLGGTACMKMSELAVDDLW